MVYRFSVATMTGIIDNESRKMMMMMDLMEGLNELSQNSFNQ
jgi:hypothetical protein